MFALCSMAVSRTFLVSRAMLPGYADTDTGTRYGDTPIRHFSKNKDTGIRQYIYNNIAFFSQVSWGRLKMKPERNKRIEVSGTRM